MRQQILEEREQKRLKNNEKKRLKNKVVSLNKLRIEHRERIWIFHILIKWFENDAIVFISKHILIAWNILIAWCNRQWHGHSMSLIEFLIGMLFVHKNPFLIWSWIGLVGITKKWIYWALHLFECTALMVLWHTNGNYANKMSKIGNFIF